MGPFLKMAHQNPKGPLIESDEVVVRFLDETYGARRCVDMMGV